MARRKSKGRHVGARSTVNVTIDVPVQYANRFPSFLRAPAPYSRQRRRGVVSVQTTPFAKTVRRRFRVSVPRHSPRPSYVAVDRRGRVRIYSRAKTKRLLVREMNRKRYAENKVGRRRARKSVAYLGSLRRDTFGLVGSAHARGASPDRLADAAMVSRALERSIR